MNEHDMNMNMTLAASSPAFRSAHVSISTSTVSMTPLPLPAPAVFPIVLLLGAVLIGEQRHFAHLAGVPAQLTPGGGPIPQLATATGAPKDLGRVAESLGVAWSAAWVLRGLVGSPVPGARRAAAMVAAACHVLQ